MTIETKEQQNDTTSFVFVEGDQNLSDSGAIESLVQSLRSEAQSRDTVVVGVSDCGWESSSVSRFPFWVKSHLIRLLIFALYGRWLKAALPSYMAIPTTLLQKLDIRLQGAGRASEIMAKLLRGGFVISEVPFRIAPLRIHEYKPVSSPSFLRTCWIYIKHWAQRPEVTSGNHKASDFLVFVYGVSRIFIGLVLLGAGLSKLLTPHALLIGNWFLLPVIVVALCGLLETALGLACISFVPYRALPLVLGVLFAFFCVLLTTQWFAGASNCQCLGATSPPIAWMLTIDVAILVSLVLFRKCWQSGIVFRNQFVDEQFRNARFVIPLVLVFGIGFFGSIDGFIGFLSGAPLVIDSSSQSVDSVLPNERADLTFVVRNITSRDITLIGARASCRCVAIQDLPLTIGPKQVVPIRVSIHGQGSRGIQRESAVLLEQDSAFQLPLRASVIVRSNPMSAPRSQ